MRTPLTLLVSPTVVVARDAPRERDERPDPVTPERFDDPDAARIRSMMRDSIVPGQDPEAGTPVPDDAFVSPAG